MAVAVCTQDRPRPARTEGPVVAKFFERRIRHAEGASMGRPFVLEEWQRDDLDLIYELDERGERRWRRVLWGQARGNGKTPTTSSCGLLELARRDDAPLIIAAAGSKDQAKPLIEFTKPCVEKGPLRDFMQVRAMAVLLPRYRGVMRIVAADGDLLMGKNLSAALLDELHVFKTTKQEEVYWALATALKRWYSWELAITTAGWSKNTLLGEKFDAAMEWPDVWQSDDGFLTIARDEASKQLMIWRGAPDDADLSDPAVWRAANPASWVDMDYLRMQAGGLPANVFRRLHLNQWTEGEDQVLSAQAWNACADEDAARLEDGASVYLAVNVSQDRQSAARVAVGRLPDGRFAVDVRLWEDENPEHIDELVKTDVRECCSRWHHQSLAFDPWQFGQAAAELSDDGVELYRGAHAEKLGMPQTPAFMVPASRLLLKIVSERRLVHDGSRPLRRQMLAVQAKQTDRDVWRLERPKPEPRSETSTRVVREQRCDAAFALAMGLLAADVPDVAPWAGAW